MLIFSIETSCDETAAAVVRGDLDRGSTAVLSNIVSSQVKIHAQWGGVVPNLAAREHLKNFPAVLDQALQEANVKIQDIDLVAVTQGPGLIPALLIGTNVAKTISYIHNKPLIGIHHIEGHIYANLAIGEPIADSELFPLVCLVVSGGHTQLVLMKNHMDYEIIGQTLDDAAGEAFDKAAKMMELGYPGGPVVSQRASKARDEKASAEGCELVKQMGDIHLPRPLLSQPNLDFSFSGLKTAALYFYRNLLKSDPENLEQWKNFICLAFEEAVVDVLVKKTLRAVKTYHPKTVMLAGGVAANAHLRRSLGEALAQHNSEVRYLQPLLEYCGDNAAMIGIAAFYRFKTMQNNNQLKQLDSKWKTLEADANLKLI